MKIKFTGDFKKLIPMGFTFHKLYASNYKVYEKSKVWIWVAHGGYVEIDDFFSNSGYIAVDTHVYRISNRLGWVKTKTPDKTEFALKKAVPKKYWYWINELFVIHGQKICNPLSPKCSICPVNKLCPKIGVGKSR